jgi:hypothetical protein
MAVKLKADELLPTLPLNGELPEAVPPAPPAPTVIVYVVPVVNPSNVPAR